MKVTLMTVQAWLLCTILFITLIGFFGTAPQFLVVTAIVLFLLIPVVLFFEVFGLFSVLSGFITKR